MSGDKISVTVSGGASDPVARARRYAAAPQIGPRGLIVDLADAVELARGERDALERQVVADSAWRASLEQELKTARAERDVARAKVAVVTDTSQKYAEALDKVINERDELRGELDWRVKRLREERDKALSELDAVVAALDEANQTLAEERTRAVDYARLDPSSPADLRRVADLLRPWWHHGHRRRTAHRHHRGAPRPDHPSRRNLAHRRDIDRPADTDAHHP